MSFEWAVKNRSGLAFLSGKLILPSQFYGQQSLPKYVKNVQPFTIDMPDDTTLSGVIVFPESENKDSRAVLMHNPNGMVLKHCFNGHGILQGLPREIMNLSGQHLILYDYRGTGMNTLQPNHVSSISFQPTYHTILQDGNAVTKFAADNFGFNLDIFGSSLGGGVAAVTMANYLRAEPKYKAHWRLFHHDSFTTTAKVVMQNFASDWLAWIFGGLIDAKSAMMQLLKQRVRVCVMYHELDPVIPVGARMCECLPNNLDDAQLCIISSPEYGHANISDDMKGALQKAFREL